MKQNGKLNDDEQTTLDEVERRAQLEGDDAALFLKIRNLIVGASVQAADNWDLLHEKNA